MKKRAYFILSALLCSQSTLLAVATKIRNADCLVKGQAGAVANPKHWKVVSEKNLVRAKVLSEKKSVFNLQKGGCVQVAIDMPELNEPEKKVKGEWRGLVIVDALTATTKSGRWQLEILDDKGEQIFSSKNRTRNSDVKNLRKGRVWINLPNEVLTTLMSKKATLRLKGLTNEAVAFAGVEVIRYHAQPNGRLENKPNGRLGPDRLAAGALGFTALLEHQQSVLSIHGINKGGAAEKAGLKVGDLITGVNGKPLSRNSCAPGWQWYNEGHEAVLGRAVLAAFEKNTKAISGLVRLDVLREGKIRRVSLRIPNVYLPEGYYAQAQGMKMKDDMLEFLVRKQSKNGNIGGPIRTTFAALAWLSDGNPKYTENIFRAVNWMLNRYPNAENFGNLGFWHASYAGMLYCEYYLATGDKRVLPRIQAIHDWTMTGVHTSKWGMPCLGHGTGGLPYGNKALMAPLSHMLVFEALAKRCGADTQLWETMLPYTEYSWSDPKKGGHGSMGYNASYKDKGEFWSRTGQCALACALRGERNDMQTAMTGFMEKSYPWFRNSHAYGEPGGAWGIISLAYAAPEAYAKVMNAYRGAFALSWEPGYGMHFTQSHMGAPYMGREDLYNSAYALAFNAHKKSLHLTGSNKKNWLDVSKMKIPVSDVLVRRKPTGEIWLETRIAGGEIYYTLDGSEPSVESKKYSEPLNLNSGQKLRSVCIQGETKGKVAEFVMDTSVPKIIVAQASGHKDPKEAMRRAQHTIDKAQYHAWIPDRGQDAKGYPHHVVYDFGEVREIKAVEIFQRGATKVKLTSAKTAYEKPTDLLEQDINNASRSSELVLKQPIQARYLRVEFSEPLDEKKPNLIVRELLVK